MIKAQLWEVVFKALDVSVWAKNQFQMMFARDKGEETYPMKPEFEAEKSKASAPKVKVTPVKTAAKKTVAKSAPKKSVAKPRPAMTLAGKPRQKPGPKPGSKRVPKPTPATPSVKAPNLSTIDPATASAKKIVAGAKRMPAVTLKAQARKKV